MKYKGNIGKFKDAVKRDKNANLDFLEERHKWCEERNNSGTSRIRNAHNIRNALTLLKEMTERERLHASLEETVEDISDSQAFLKVMFNEEDNHKNICDNVRRLVKKKFLDLRVFPLIRYAELQAGDHFRFNRPLEYVKGLSKTHLLELQEDIDVDEGEVPSMLIQLVEGHMMTLIAKVQGEVFPISF